MAKQSHQTMTYEREYRDVPDRLCRENGTVCSLEYFLNSAEQWFAETRRTLQMTVLGLGVPEELICAAGAVPLSCALAVGAVFALCSAISPMLLLLLLSGALAGRMYREIPQYLSWFRLGCYILLVIFFAAELGSVL